MYIAAYSFCRKKRQQSKFITIIVKAASDLKNKKNKPRAVRSREVASKRPIYMKLGDNVSDPVSLGVIHFIHSVNNPVPFGSLCGKR